MGTPKFEAFPDIKQIGKAMMSITQKIHGTNAHILIVPVDGRLKYRDDFSNESYIDPNTIEIDGKFYDVYCGSRNRYVYPGDDNYGFATFVHANKEAFVRTLGVGRHDGEWAGLGINSGEGLTEKRFVLFDFWKYPPERPLPPQTCVVPVLYSGPMNLAVIDEVMMDLKVNGSKLVPGFPRPEGVVIQCMGVRYKKVFQNEDAKWKKGDENYQKLKDAQRVPEVDYSHLLQPIRLEKLLSRDEAFVRDYPKCLPKIAEAYFADLKKEDQVTGTEGEIAAIQKGSRNQIFKFIREFMENRESFAEQLT